MSCGMCFECDNCVVYCPQTAVFRVPKAKSTLGRYVDTDYNKCIGCHICADVCPTGYIQMVWVNNEIGIRLATILFSLLIASVAYAADKPQALHLDVGKGGSALRIQS